MSKRLYKITGTGGSSGLNSCPTVIGDEEDEMSVIIQGYEVDAETRVALSPIPGGENAVRIPRSMILAAAREIAGSA